jgi:filamentous hemagglutinin family protein
VQHKIIEEAAMKNNKRNSANGQVGTFKLRNHALVTALAAAGFISFVPSIAAPLPTPCSAGCTANNLPFVQAGSATASTSGTAMTIQQKSATAVLNWKDFNIAKGYSVEFKQPSATSSALNRIWDSNPSNISGSLTSNGQVYLINHNGIVFGNGAQVNTGALIASSLDISDSLFQSGYLNNPTALPAFQGSSGFVKVEGGATISGERVMMFAPVVENNGNISTPGGQTILAAGNKVYLEASQDPNLRGVLVEVDVTTPGVADTALAGQGLQHTELGVVSNAGSVQADRGNITLVGYAVNQQGRLSATTSVTENGSVKLLARYNVSNQANLADQNIGLNVNDIRATTTGKVTLAAGSVTEVKPELADVATTTDGQGFKPSIVEVMGKTITMENGSSIVANGGKVTLAAIGSINATAGGNNVYQEIFKDNAYSSFLNPTYKPVADASGARVFLDNGSSIDVSGSNASVSVARDILTMKLFGSQLQNSPLQNGGFLRGKEVNIDIRKGSALVNYAGEEAQIGRTVAERTATGGTVALISTGDVVTKSGSKINLSGGQVNHFGDYVKSTNLISNGVSYDIATASPNLIYDGIAGTYSVTHKKWGVVESWNTLAGGDTRGRWDAGYVEGKSAGTLTVLAPQAALNGDIVAKTVAGIYQTQPFAATTSAPYKKTWQMLPQGGELVIGDSSAVKDSTTGISDYVNNMDVKLQTNTAQLPGNFAEGDALPSSSLSLGSNLFAADKVSRLAVYSNKSISVDADAKLNLATGSNLKLQANTIDMLGEISARAGSVSMTTVQTTGTTQAGNINIGATGAPSRIDTRGVLINDSLQQGTSTSPQYKDGGNITINSGADLVVGAGTQLDASAGASIDVKGKIQGGNGGAISLSSGKPLSASASFVNKLEGLDLKSYGVEGGKGGTLNIKAGDITLAKAGDISGLSKNNNGVLILSPEFFQTGGFSNYNLTSQGFTGLTVADNAVITPQAQSLILDSSALTQVSGTDINSFAKAAFLPDWKRQPTSITLSSIQDGATTKVGLGAAIKVAPKGSISLNSASQLTVLGTLDAAAGAINLKLSTVSDTYNPNQSIWLGANSQLLSKGATLLQPDVNNLQRGQVLAGGKININGVLVAQKGSLMDVSGTSATLDLAQKVAGVLSYQPTLVAGNAGSISVKSVGGAVLDGTMKAGVDVNTAAGGSFALEVQQNNHKDITVGNNASYPQGSREILVEAAGNGTFIATQLGTQATNDSKAGTTDLTAVEGKAFVDAKSLQDAGFDQITLKSYDKINFADQVVLDAKRSITLDAPLLNVAGNATVNSAYVKVANTDPSNQTVVSPVGGTGILNVTGQLVDVTGNVSVSGVNKVSITSAGDIRLNGVLKTDTKTFDGALKSPDGNYYALQGGLLTQGNISLQAKQVYTSSMSQFALKVQDDNDPNTLNNVTISGGAQGATPVLSAGGQLSVSADDILQNGVLKAPTGSINLNGSHSVTLGTGSLTSVSGEGQTVPFGSIQSGKDWVYDLTGAGNFVSITTPPEKKIKLTGPNVDVKTGATVDLSGGGNLAANEFLPGPPTSAVDILNPANAAANTFAIIPGVSGYSPYDPQLSGQYQSNSSKSTLNVGDSVYLAGGAGIAAGYYTLLPASYALLKGGYTVALTSGNTYQDMQPGMVVNQLDGSHIMAGKFASVGTNTLDARWSGFQVTPGSVARTQSQYVETDANTFFTNQAKATGIVTPRLPIDAGQLVVAAQGANAKLVFDGTFNTQAGANGTAKGKGALVDLSGPGFDIVNAIGADNGLVQLDTNALNKLGVESLLIGGVRSQGTNGMNIAVDADQVVVDNAGSTLQGAEIILAANTAVTVKSGSAVQGTGTFTGQASDITIDNSAQTNTSGNGALLRVSTGSQITVARNNADLSAGALTIEKNAALGAQDNALLLDSSNSTSIDNSAKLVGKAFSVAAQNIDIGNAPATTTSLALSSTLLAQIQKFQDLTLHSYNDINIYGDASLGGLDASNKHLLNSLTLNAKNLNGVNNTGLTNYLDASKITWLNNNGSSTATTTYAGGKLALNADSIVIAGGDKSINGYGDVNFTALNEISMQGSGTATIASGDNNPHTLLLNAGQITATSKAKQQIAANNYDVKIESNTGTTFAPTETLAAKLTISGKSIHDAGVINVPTGSIILSATGTGSADNVLLAAGSKTVAKGITKTIAGQAASADAGSVTLSSANGGVSVENTALVDVSAAGSGDAGNINVVAAKGDVVIAGNLQGTHGTTRQGTFTLDANTLDKGAAAGVNPLTDLNKILTDGGFTEKRDMRIRTGDQTLAADVSAIAKNFHLVVDAGKIDVLGKIDSSGSNGGDVLLAASGDVTVKDGALLDAHATTGTGGKVALETTAGAINLITPSNTNTEQIDVHGLGNTGGSVLLRAPQINNGTDVAVNTAANTSIKTSAGAKVTVEAFKSYNQSTIATADTSTSSAFFTDATQFSGNAATIKNRLGMSLTDTNMHLTPGVQISSSGDLNLNADWDLSQWRFDDGTGALNEAGVLTLNAAGNLNINNSLSDGFTSAISYTPINGNSWAYRLIAGADTASANVMAVTKTGSTNGSVLLAAGGETYNATTGVTTGTTTTIKKGVKVTTPSMKQIRTGSGFIDVAAGGNIALGNRDSVVYTAGQPASILPASLLASPSKVFPVGGGDISLYALGNINATGQDANGDPGTGSLVNQLVTEWQFRQGALNTDGSFKTQPAWWINYSSFRQNIGALGGGNVSVNAGGNINNLSVVAPTSGYVAAPSATPTLLNTGNVSINAGGEINSGVFYVGNGQGEIRAGGNLGSTRIDPNTANFVATILALGSGNFDVRTGGDLKLQTVLNPTAVSQGYTQLPKGKFAGTNYFFTYGDTSGISLSSLAGDVSLANNINSLSSEYGLNPGYAGLSQATVYPGTLQATALGGSITDNAQTLFPSVTGNLKLIAARDINILGSTTLSNNDPNSLQASLPVSQGDKFPSLISGNSTIHAGDTHPVIIAAGESVIGDNSINVPNLVLPKSAVIQAGQDVRNLSLAVQNQNSSDTTSVIAGRDIVFTPQGSASTPGIAVAGPGQVVLQAGRDIDLGQSQGVVTKGNLANPLLDSQGASITVLAGVGQGTQATQSYIDTFINPANISTYVNAKLDPNTEVGKNLAPALATYVESHGAAKNLSAKEVFAYFKTLPTDVQSKFITGGADLIAYVNSHGASVASMADAYTVFSGISDTLKDTFINQVFFAQLQQSGRSAAKSANYAAGYDSIETLFPAKGVNKGDVNLFYSQIKTERGGDINIYTPGGSVNAGLATSTSNGPVKTAAELGIVSVSGGSVNAFVDKDFLVNQSRVFTIQGGNILMWASKGNIDAGKGSKTSSATPAPLVVVDLKTGAFSLDASGSIVGSGIQALQANKKVAAGTIDLYAPTGEINAGDAGISSAGNIFLGAPRVVGGDNISFGGSSVGVPVAAPAPVSVSGMGNMQDASKAADQATQNMANASDMAKIKDNLANFKPSFLSVEVVGLGDEEMDKK